MEQVIFTGTIGANATILEGVLNIPSEVNVDILQFEIFVDGKSTGIIRVGEEKYKSAMLIDYFSQTLGKGQYYFQLTDRHDVHAFYGKDLCNDAMYNPETIHSTIRDLLADGKVWIKVTRKTGITFVDDLPKSCSVCGRCTQVDEKSDGGFGIEYKFTCNLTNSDLGWFDEFGDYQIAKRPPPNLCALVVK